MSFAGSQLGFVTLLLKNNKIEYQHNTSNDTVLKFRLKGVDYTFIVGTWSHDYFFNLSIWKDTKRVFHDSVDVQTKTMDFVNELLGFKTSEDLLKAIK